MQKIVDIRALVPSRVVLENGEEFNGFSPQYCCGTHYGEIVFTTGMTGYPETLTDPSYAGQMVCFTYPLIGNYGVPDCLLWESSKIYASGVVISELSSNWHHHEGEQSFLEWLYQQKIPLIQNIDTRALTKALRQSGTMRGVITTGNSPFDFQDNTIEELVKKVSIPLKKVYHNPKAKKVIYAIDCGMKENIVRALASFPLEIHRVPYNYDFTDEEYDGLFISNGPGDPTQCQDTIRLIQRAMKKNKPIFGICLGIQLLALAAGAKTFKLPFGHRGHNQPCMNLMTNQCYITSQNHGYAVEQHSLPSDWQVTFINLNDRSVAGIEHKSLPFFAVQFHPEATPGPTDTHWLFEKFYEML